jgi:hypothetical protein
MTAGRYRLQLRRIEGRWEIPTLSLLHRGPGTIAVWGDVPEALCRATGYPGVIHERLGCGASDAGLLPWPDHGSKPSQRSRRTECFGPTSRSKGLPGETRLRGAGGCAPCCEEAGLS